MGLTVIEVKTAKPKSRNYKLSDGGGMYLLVQPNGSKYWRFSYRYMGKQKTLALGVYPNINLQQARHEREIAKKKLYEDIDPCEERKALKNPKNPQNTNTFESVANEWFKKQSHIWVKSHSDDVIRRLEVNIYPSLGSLEISSIQPIDVLNSVRKIENRGAFDLAHRVLGVCGQVFRYAVSCSYCKSDPTRDLKGALTPHIKKHFAAVKPEELPLLMQSILNYEEIGDVQTKLGLQLLALTFVRTQELTGAKWEEFDFEKLIWTVPAIRTKLKREHLIPLSPQVIVILKKLKITSEQSKYIFMGRNPLKQISNNTLLFALYRIGYKTKMTGHGFRTVASTILNESGFRFDVVEKQLAHLDNNRVRDAYNRAEYMKERALMMDWWANYLDLLSIN